MEIACLDLEGVLVPEIWIAFAEKTGIESLKATTRDIPDYDVLMQQRLRILDEHGLKLKDIQDVIATLKPLDGAVEFVDWLRERFQVVILSDTFYEFSQPLMRQLGFPTLLCHRLITDENDRVVSYQLRQKDPKRQSVIAFKSLYYRVIAAGDSYNDTTMLSEAHAGILFHAPENVIREFPQFPAVHTYEDLKQEFLKASNRKLSPTFLKPLQRFQQYFHLGDGLLILGLPVGVSDDAATAPAADLAVLDQQAANGNGTVHLAAHVEIQERAAVEAAPGRLELIDDLHGADLRRTGDGAAGETAGDQVQRILARCKLGGDATDQVMHVGIALQGEQLRYFHRTDAAAAAQIVAQQIDDHQVLGSILAARQQLLRLRLIIVGVIAAAPSALDRTGFHMTVADLEKALGRQAENGVAIAQAPKTRERRGAGLAQCQVSRPGIARAGRLKALGEVHLIAIASEDVALDAFDRLAIAVLVDSGLERLGQSEGHEFLAMRCIEQRPQALALCLRQRRVKQQCAGTQLVIADQCPGVETETGILEIEIIDALFG